MKNSSDIIGNRTSDLPACSAVSQPTAPPRAPNVVTHANCRDRDPSSGSICSVRENFWFYHLTILVYAGAMLYKSAACVLREHGVAPQDLHLRERLNRV